MSEKENDKFLLEIDLICRINKSKIACPKIKRNKVVKDG